MTSPGEDAETAADLRRRLRAEAIARRDALDAATVAAWSAALGARLHAAWPAPPGRIIGFCWPVRNEPDLRPQLLRWRAAGRR